MNPTGWKTPKTASRLRRCITLPATWSAGPEFDTVNRIVSDDGLTATYAPAYKVAAGWGRVAVEQEIEAIDANSKRRWTIEASAVHAIFAIPGYTEIED